MSEEAREKDNHIYVSGHRRVSTFVDLSCNLFANYEEVYLHGLSNAIANTADIAQLLDSSGKATISKIETAMLQRPKNARRGNPPGLVIVMKTSPDFTPPQPVA